VTPVYRCVLKDSESHPTCVVAGHDRRNCWLYVHATTPTVLRLHPPVVQFLWEALARVAAMPDWPVPGFGPVHWWLPRNTAASYPDCAVTGRSRRDTWLYVYAAAPSAVKLVPQLVEFLQDVLVDLPAAPTRHDPATGQFALT